MHTQHTLCWEAVAFKCMSFNMCYGCVLNAGNRCACMCVECSCALCTHAIVCAVVLGFILDFVCNFAVLPCKATRIERDFPSVPSIYIWKEIWYIFCFDSLFLFSFVNAFFILSSSSSSYPSPIHSQRFASIMVDFCLCLIWPMYFLHSTFRVNCNWFYWYALLVHEWKFSVNSLEVCFYLHF